MSMSYKERLSDLDREAIARSPRRSPTPSPPRSTSGELAPGAQLPPTRELAELAGVNHLTAARAYRKLAELGLVAGTGRPRARSSARRRPRRPGARRAGRRLGLAALRAAGRGRDPLRPHRGRDVPPGPPRRPDPADAGLPGRRPVPDRALRRDLADVAPPGGRARAPIRRRRGRARAARASSPTLGREQGFADSAGRDRHHHRSGPGDDARRPGAASPRRHRGGRVADVPGLAELDPRHRAPR